MPLLRKIVIAVLTASLLLSTHAFAQTGSEMAALEARLMARLEMRLSQETEVLRSEQLALRASVQEAVRTLARSQDQIDRRALAAVATGRTDAGLEALEERARARDVRASTGGTPEERQARADEWRRIGAVAFLESTERSVAAFEQALTFTPNDGALLAQLASLYQRQGRYAEQRQIGERLVSLPDPTSRAKGYMSIALAAASLGENSEAMRASDAAVSAARQSPEPSLLVEALCARAITYAVATEFRDAERAAEEAMSVARAHNLQLELGFAHAAAGQIHYVRAAQSLFNRPGPARRAITEFESAIEIFRSTNHPEYEADALITLSAVERIAGNAPNGEARARAAIAIAEPLQARGYLSYAYSALGMALAAQERREEARTAFERGVIEARPLQNDRALSLALFAWGDQELQWRNRVRACELLTESSALIDARRLGTSLERFAVRMAKTAACG